jgi:dTDP-glucose pyrophosphorylase
MFLFMQRDSSIVRTARSAVILARGLGTRMRKQDPDAELATEQSAAADSGMKGMIPIGRPFMDYVLSALADAGFTRVCLVIGPEHGAVRHYYTVDSPPTRITIDFAIQEKALGTADAVLAAESFANGEPFVVLNSDNYYPVEALRALASTEPPALVAFARSALLEKGNVEPERVTRFGALVIDENGYLMSITPRPGSAAMNETDEVYASMNCWLFDNSIFEACRRVPVSPRDEFELPRAVQLAIDTMEIRFRTVRIAAPVYDLSTRGDIASVQQRLASVNVVT